MCQQLTISAPVVKPGPCPEGRNILKVDFAFRPLGDTALMGNLFFSSPDEVLVYQPQFVCVFVLVATIVRFLRFYVPVYFFLTNRRSLVSRHTTRRLKIG